MSGIDRRDFLHLTARYGGGALVGFSALQALYDLGRVSHARLHGAAPGAGGYGPLRPAGEDLALPEGFRYIRFGVAGDPMSDGVPTPAAPDGMAAFPLPNGNIRLIRNHELVGREPDAPPYRRPYDDGPGGGTTSLEVDPESRELLRSFRTLEGTVRNCAGGPTPWGSWLSCEEATAGSLQGLEKEHGYVFEVPVSAEAPVEPVPLTGLGRFVHEAVAVDPATSIVYLTEDQTRAGLYRFIPDVPAGPDQPARLAAGGRLQMLAIQDMPRYDASRGQRPGRALPVHWIGIPDPDPDDAEENPDAVFRQGWSGGAARFSRVEGCWYAGGAICFTSTNGGDAGLGQVWEFRPTEPEGGELRLLFESPDASLLQYPDNVCVSPRGGVVLCEDGDVPNHVRGLTPDGRVFDFARNLSSGSEFAGATFSPDGRTLFVNVQREPGATYAIWGPWERGAL